MDVDRNELYVQKLKDLDLEYNQKIEDLITQVNKSDKLPWIKFSRDLQEIKEDYKGYILGLVLGYNLETNTNIYEEVYTPRVKSLTTLCNDTFDKIYEQFEKTNGII